MKKVNVILLALASYSTIFSPPLTATSLKELKDSLDNVKTKLTDLSGALGSLTKPTVVTSSKQLQKLLQTTPDKLATLKNVVLENKKLTEAPDLTSLIEATSVDLSVNSINTPKAITKLSTKLPPKVRSLDLSENGIKDVESIKALKNLPDTVKSLDLSYNDINTPDRIAALAELPKNIKILDLTENFINHEDKITKLKNLPDSIKHLYLSACGIDNDEKLTALLKVLSQKNITHLDLSETNLGEQKDIQALAQLPESVKYLDISNCNIDPSQLSDEIANLPNTVETLDMKGNKTKAGAYVKQLILQGFIYKLVANSGRHEGRYKKAGPSSTETSTLHSLLSIPEETDLNTLDSASITDKQLEKIPNLKKLITATSLDLTNNKINSKESVQHLCNNLPPNTASLILQENILNSPDALTELRNLPTSISYLDLSRNKISSNDSIKALADLPSTITALDLSKNKIDPEKQQDALGKLPNTIETLRMKNNYMKVGDMQGYPAKIILSGTEYNRVADSGEKEGVYRK